MRLASSQQRQHGQCTPASVVGAAQEGECHEDLVGVQSRIASSEVLHLGLLDGLDEVLGNESHTVFYAGQVLGGIEQQGSAGAEQGT